MPISQKYLNDNNFMSKLKKIDNNPFYTFAGLGEEYGISRERVRQLFNKHFGRAPNKKRGINCNIEIECKWHSKFKKERNPKKNIGEERFYNVCKERGFDIKFSKKLATGIIINDYKINVLNGKLVDTGRGNKYMTGTFSNSCILKYDFLIIHFNYTFYIIPKKETKKRKYKIIFYIPLTTEHKYKKYLNNFNQLKAK